MLSDSITIRPHIQISGLKSFLQSNLEDNITNTVSRRELR